jgi:hypothetical protein
MSGIAVTQHTNAAIGGTIAWPESGKRNAQPPYLKCSGLVIAGAYDSFGPGPWSTPEDAVLDDLREEGSKALAGYDPDLIEGVSRDNLVPIWRQDSPSGATVSLLLRIDGANVAIFNVNRYLMAEGQPITWQESGWGVGGYTACDVATDG